MIITVKEAAFLLFPTAIGYYSGVSSIFHTQGSLNVVIFAIILVLLTTITLKFKKTEYEKHIAQVLETGYFMNFIDRTVVSILGSNLLNVNYPHAESVKVDRDKICIKVLLPESQMSLDETKAVVKDLSIKGSLDDGTWIFHDKNIDDKLVIYDYPRTMTAFAKYLKDKQYDEKKSKIMHHHFNSKFKEDWKSTSLITENITTFMFVEIPATFKYKDIVSKLKNIDSFAPQMSI